MRLLLRTPMPRGKSARTLAWEAQPRTGDGRRFASPRVDATRLPPPAACTRSAQGAVVLSPGGAGARPAHSPFTGPPGRVLIHGYPLRVGHHELREFGFDVQT